MAASTRRMLRWQSGEIIFPYAGESQGAAAALWHEAWMSAGIILLRRPGMSCISTRGTGFATWRFCAVP